MAVSERIVLGSGKLYAVVGTKTNGAYTIPADTELEQESNLIGFIQGGATIEYAPEFYTAEDDLGIVQKKYLTDETVTLRSGVMTWNTDTLKKLVATGVVSTEGTKSTIKIGGVENFDNSQYVLRFVHKDKLDGDIRVTVVGSNDAGFNMQFQKDAETVIDAEFSAVPQDKKGTLLVIEFSEPASAGE